MHFPGHGSILLGVGCAHHAGQRPSRGSGAMPIDLRSPLHSSASMIADFLADNEPLVGGPCRKKGPLTGELAPVLWRRGSWNILLHRKYDGTMISDKIFRWLKVKRGERCRLSECRGGNRRGT